MSLLLQVSAAVVYTPFLDRLYSDAIKKDGEEGYGKEIPATCYSPTTERRSTITAEAFHFRVRNGYGCFILAIVTGNISKLEN